MTEKDKFDRDYEKAKNKKKLPLHVHHWEKLGEIGYLMRQTPGKFKHLEDKDETL